MGRKKILIIEDDVAFGKLLHGWFVRNGYDAEIATTVASARETVSTSYVDLIVTDLRLPDGDGIMFLSWLVDSRKEIPVILMTGYAEIQSAVAAMKLGALDYLEKPVNPSILKEKVEQAFEKSKKPEPVREKKPSLKPNLKIIQGDTAAARQMERHIKLVAPTRMSVIIFGESGTGKEFAARAIHQASQRSSAPFIAVDCGSLSYELAPSELFGHVKGSFTSAVSDKKGVFEEASGGTVFLDEIGNLSYDVQVQLLRALQERRIRPVGSASDIEIDIRIIAATNEELLKLVREGNFREDLYHRLNEFSITIPPLRERRDDIPLFAAHFLEEANEELGKDIASISPAAMEILLSQHWSGNLREMRNVVRRGALFASGREILPEHLPLMEATSGVPEEEVAPLRGDGEREKIIAALKRAGGNKSRAAKLLGVDRKTLYNKMHALDIEF